MCGGQAKTGTTEAVERAACCPILDLDGDGYTEEEGDCDDADGTIHPGASETCNGIDDDCDDEVDEDVLSWWSDADGDEHGIAGRGGLRAAGGHGRCGRRCDDTDPGISPSTEKTPTTSTMTATTRSTGVLVEYADTDGDGWRRRLYPLLRERRRHEATAETATTMIRT